MTVSSGSGGGGTLVGSVVAAGGMGGVGAGSAGDALPFTGADHVVLLVVLGVVMIVVGLLIVGLSRRHGPSHSRT